MLIIIYGSNIRIQNNRTVSIFGLHLMRLHNISWVWFLYINFQGDFCWIRKCGSFWTINSSPALSESYCYCTEGLTGGPGWEIRRSHPILPACSQVFPSHFETCVNNVTVILTWTLCYTAHDPYSLYVVVFYFCYFSLCAYVPGLFYNHILFIKFPKNLIHAVSGPKTFKKYIECIHLNYYDVMPKCLYC